MTLVLFLVPELLLTFDTGRPMSIVIVVAKDSFPLLGYQKGSLVMENEGGTACS